MTTGSAPPASDERIGETIFGLLAQRDASASICPSEVARALAADDAGWRALMPEVRRVAAVLAQRGLLRVTRGADDVDARVPGGPVRLRRLP